MINTLKSCWLQHKVPLPIGTYSPLAFVFFVHMFGLGPSGAAPELLNFHLHFNQIPRQLVSTLEFETHSVIKFPTSWGIHENSLTSVGQKTKNCLKLSPSKLENKGPVQKIQKQRIRDIQRQKVIVILWTQYDYSEHFGMCSVDMMCILKYKRQPLIHSFSHSINKEHLVGTGHWGDSDEWDW